MTERLTAAAVQAQQLFDAKAATWSAKYAPTGPLASRFTWLSAAIDRHVQPAGAVLDLGCGAGDLARSMAARGYQTTACDISGQMLGHARVADQAGMVTWLQLDPGWQVLPFPSGSFDAVVASSVLEYVAEPVRVLSECHRVLRPGGIVLCTVPDPAHPVRRLESAARLIALLPLAPLTARCSPKVLNYVTYLRISRQRRSERWWHRAAGRTGLCPVSDKAGTGPRSTLRLLALRRPDDRGASS